MHPPIFSALALVATLQAAPSDSSQLVAREAWVMGTRLGVVVEAASASEARKATENVIREVERLERILSTWDPHSEVHAINTGEVGRPISPGAELAFLLAEAERYSRISGGAFDARIGALVDAWDLPRRRSRTGGGSPAGSPQGHRAEVHLSRRAHRYCHATHGSRLDRHWRLRKGSRTSCRSQSTRLG